uniref:TBC1 domain family member 24 isoform X2 n=1 Tax=Myxine glutinosa TaxID=7769 RepID=UPI00358E9C51
MEDELLGDCARFVDWNVMPRGISRPSPEDVPLPITMVRQLKQQARQGRWAKNHKLRAVVYHSIIKALPCRVVTPDADVYRDWAAQRGAKSALDAFPKRLPVFAKGVNPPVYCLTSEGHAATWHVLLAIEVHFPDVTYCPALPGVIALLAHFLPGEPELFEAVSRLLACTDASLHLLDQTFRANEASCMTFADLVNKYSTGAHRVVAARCSSVLEVYSDWLTWLFEDLPFEYTACVFDSFLLEGHKVLYRAGLALLKFYKTSVKAKTLAHLDAGNGLRAEVRGFVRNIAWHTIPDHLMERAFGVRLLSRKEISLLRHANEHALLARGVTRRPSRFYMHCDGHSPTLMLIKTINKEVCGAYLSSDWAERKKECNRGLTFFGTGECFVFRLHPEVERYEWIIIHRPELAMAKAETWTDPAEDAEQMATSEKLLQTKHENATDHEHPDARQIGGLSPFLATRHFKLPSKSASMFMFGSNDFIIIGGGDGEALHIDGDLDHGRSSHCNTFDNPPLCSENFRIQVLEVWAFGNAQP